MKKKIPLVILEALQPIINNNLDCVSPVKDDHVILSLRDIDSNSDFFFKVIKQERQPSRGIVYLAEHKPANSTNVDSCEFSLPIDSVVERLNGWLKILRSYNEIHTIYDDPILKSYEDNYTAQFKIVDEDANLSGFNLQQQLYIDEYLDEVKNRLLAFEEDKTELEKEKIQELISEATRIQSNLTQETKNEVMKRLVRFWAKAQRVGIKVIKEIFVGYMVELTKRLLPPM